MKTRIKTLVRAKISPRLLRVLKNITGRDQPDEVDWIHKYLEKKIQHKVMIDVGAHYGESLSPFLFDNWKVFAFEPDPENMKELQSLTKSRNLILDTRGCSNKSVTDINFYKSNISTGISSMSAFDKTHTQSNKIDTVTIKDFADEKNISEVGFLKIDTEGHDLFVLEGIPWDIIKPEVIVAEFEDRKTINLGYCYHDMAKILIDNGYTVLISEWHPIQQYGSKHKWRSLNRYPYNLIDSNGWGNMIAFRDPSLASIIEINNK